MIGGERRGPYELDELSGAGVRPDTYVWCKTMTDWQQARDVAELCRHFRRQLAGLNIPEKQPAENSVSEDPQDNIDTVPLRFRNYVRRSGTPVGDPLPEESADPDSPPRSMLVPAVIATLLCFPLTGFVAIYFAIMTRRLWKEGLKPGENAEDYRRMSHDYARQTKMWLGITFFLGLIFMAFLYRHSA